MIKFIERDGMIISYEIGDPNNPLILEKGRFDHFTMVKSNPSPDPDYTKYLREKGAVPKEIQQQGYWPINHLEKWELKRPKMEVITIDIHAGLVTIDNRALTMSIENWRYTTKVNLQRVEIPEEEHNIHRRRESRKIASRIPNPLT